MKEYTKTIVIRHGVTKCTYLTRLVSLNLMSKFLKHSIAIHFPCKCCTTKYWYVSITSVTNCSFSIRFAPLNLFILYITPRERRCIEMGPRASSAWMGVRRLCGMYKFTTNPSFGRDVNKTEVPCWESSKNYTKYFFVLKKICYICRTISVFCLINYFTKKFRLSKRWKWISSV